MRLADVKAESTRLNPDSGIKHIKTYSLGDSSQEISEILISPSQAAISAAATYRLMVTYQSRWRRPNSHAVNFTVP
jgi:hypothetical protein